MKLLIVSPCYEDSVVGAGVFLENLRKGNETWMHILTENAEEAEGVHNVEIKLSWLENKLSTFSRVKPYLKKLEKIHKKYDVVLFNNAMFAYNVPKGLNKYITFVQDDNLVNRKFGLKKLDLVYWLYSFFEKKAIQKSRLTLTNSDYLSRKIAKGYNIDQAKVKKLYLCVDIDRFPYQPKEWSSRDIIKVLFVKNDYLRGGLPELIRALESLSKYQFELNVVGCNPDLEIGGDNIKVNVLGKISNDRLPGLLMKSDIFSVPSKKEALGIANIEAMLSGTCVVATNVGGIPEVITEKEGWIARPTSSSIAEAFDRCISSPGSRREKLLKARKKAETFSVERCRLKLIEIINSL